MSELRASPGTVLAASPDLPDSNFSHAALVVCEHAAEGAFGLVFNRPAEISVCQMFPEHPLLRACQQPVFWGGPVGMDSAQFLHRAPEEIHGGEELGQGVYLGGDFEELASLLHEDSDRVASVVRVFVGYSGWEGGQLDVELEGGSWLPALLDPAVLFGEGHEPAWRAVIRSVSGMGGLSHQPPDTSWN